jgi:hypothetical protein
MRISLEEVFLQVTTEETAGEPTPAADSEPGPSEDAVSVEGEAPRA